MASDYAIKAATDISRVTAADGWHWTGDTAQFAQIIDAAFGPVLHANEHAVEKMMEVQRAQRAAEDDAKRLRMAVVTLRDICLETLKDDLEWVSGNSKSRLQDAVELAWTVLAHGAVVLERTTV